MDVGFVWQRWDARCDQVEQLQGTIDKRMADILSLMHKLPGPGQGFGAKEDFPKLMDHGDPSSHRSQQTYASQTMKINWVCISHAFNNEP